MIIWQGPGVLYHKGRKFKAGDVIPAGILSPDRLSEFVHSGKVKVDEVKELKPVYVKPEKIKPKKNKSEIEEDELLKAIELEELMKEEGN
jgi:hypothetical protein